MQPIANPILRALAIGLMATSLTVAAGACRDTQSSSPSSTEEDPRPPVPIVPATPRNLEGPRVEYSVRVEHPETHMLAVEAIFPECDESLDVFMATWTPGSYLIREFARQLEDVQAVTLAGTPLASEKISKNRWRIQCGDEDRVALRYGVYARELSVRSNFVDSEIAVINGAPTFIAPVDYAGGFDVQLEFPEGWETVTALPRHPAGDAGRFQALNFDELVDSPIVAGHPTLHEFEAGGVPHVLANFGEDALWDGERSAQDVATLTTEQQQFWQVIPYQKYWFLNLILGGGGGLEHKASTLMLTSRYATRSREDYLDWLGLVSHEFFHTWNVKRMRPAVLGPFDYEAERFTESLWIAEGITSYYDDLLLIRAGLMTREEYLERLSKQIEDVQSVPGRLVQPLGQASFDTWIKFYRGDENTPNTAISYYRKGAVVGFLLDAEIRRRTRGERSLDDVMRRVYDRFSGETGYTEAQFRDVASEVAGSDLDEFFAHAVDGADELEYREALAYYGLHFDRGDPEGDEPTPPKAHLGVELGHDGGRIVLEVVRRDGAAFAAGLNVDDEILAIDGFRVTDLPERLEAYQPDDTVTVLLARRGRILTIPVTLGEAPNEKAWSLAIESPPTAAQRAALSAWLSR